jgi:ABC-type lipoprotein export system ATPase subunit
VKSYATAAGRVDALRGIDAEIPWAAVTAVAGPSGSGKSTLLRVLAGLDAPTAGRVTVAGHDLAGLSHKSLRFFRRTSIAYVFQRPADNFVPHLSLDEHVELARRAGGPTPLEADEILERFGIREHRRDYPHELSGGEQERAAFACALVSGARIVVADEPTAELDSEASASVLSVIRTFAENGLAFVLATHDPGVVAVADSLLRLEHGLLAESAPATRPDVEPVERPETDNGPLLDARELSKTYRRGHERVHAVDGVSLRLHRSQLAALMGRSGAGKTTLLNLLGGWEEPECGRVAWPGRPGADDLRSLSWAELAFLPQKFGLLEELTIRENVEYPARLAGRRDELRDRVDELLAGLGLEELADRFPTETSIGQQQRAALARALVLAPTVLLADEPSGHQDAVWAHEVFARLRRAASAGTASLVATHNEDVRSYVDTVFQMANGRLAVAESVS